MPVKKKIKRTREVHVLVGTHKGGFRFRSDLRRRSWKVDGPFFAGAEVNHLTRDPRKGHLWAATHTAWWGSDLQVSRARTAERPGGNPAKGSVLHPTAA